jgi:DNA-binding MurR/RpiR family transcriptional regulator
VAPEVVEEGAILPKPRLSLPAADADGARRTAGRSLKQTIHLTTIEIYVSSARAVKTPSLNQRIEQQFDALSPELQRAARWVCQHPVDMGLCSMRELARRAGVAPATMTRLAQALGFEGFDGFRAPFRHALAGGEAASYLTRAITLQHKHEQPMSRYQRVNTLQQHNVASVQQLNDVDTLAAAAKLLLSSRRVMFFGLRASYGIAFHLHYVYQLIAGNGSLASDIGGTLTDQLDQLERSDVLVAISLAPYSRQTVEMTELARRRGVPVVALTDSALSPIARNARLVCTFAAESNSFFQSMTGALALTEALIVAVAMQGGRTVLTRLRQVQGRLSEQQAYWERHPRSAPL